MNTSLHRFLSCLLALCSLPHANAEDSALRKNLDGSYSVPAAALTDEARRALLGGFTYDLLPGWSLKKMPGMDYKMAFGRERGGNPANISFQVTTFGGNLAEFQAKILKEAPITFAALGITNFKVTKMSGFETTSKLMGLVAVAQAQKPDGKSVRQFYFFFDLNDRKKVLVSCSVADEGTNYDDEFIAILKTFRSTR